MKLDIDCVRSVMLELECLPVAIHTLDEFPSSIEKYGHESVEYALAKLKEAGYINAAIKFYSVGGYDNFAIYDITFSGHQFLETIRDNKIWSRTKSIAGKVGSKSFEVIAQIATAVISDLISKHLNA